MSPLKFVHRFNIDMANYKRMTETEKRLAVEDIRRFVVKQASHYPPQPPGSSYIRTGALARANKASVSFTERRTVVEVWNTSKIAPYVENGVGIYGPHHKPIVPVRARVLAWRGYQGGPRTRELLAGYYRRARSARRVGEYVQASALYAWVYAMKVKGFKGWHFLQRAVEGNTTRAFVRERMQRVYGFLRFFGV